MVLAPPIPVTLTNRSSGLIQGEIREETDMISDEVRQWFELLFFVILSGTISFVGAVANILNIVVFVHQGFRDAVNISLLGLALSDLGSLLTLVWMSVCFLPAFQYSGIQFESREIQYVTAGWPHVCFARITSWITAFITFERCLCIALPMNMKTIVTPRRIAIIIVGIFLLVFLSVAPVFFYAIHIGTIFVTERNRTLTGLIYRKNGPAVENVAFSITVFVQISSFVVVIICTCSLIYNLFLKAEWRRRATLREAAKSGNALSSRDKRVVAMVTCIACIFIACFLPSALNLICMLHFSPNYSIVGRYRNSFQVSWSILNTLEATNSSVNIIVYYKMSTKFRSTFHQIIDAGKYKW